MSDAHAPIEPGAIELSAQPARVVDAPRVDSLDGDGHVSTDAHRPVAVPVQASSHGSTRAADVASDPALGTPRADHDAPGGAGHTTREPRSSSARPDPAVDAFVGVYAILVDDAERARIALAHRLDRLTRTDEWGRGIPAEHPEMVILQQQLGENAEHEASLVRQLQRAIRRHPLGPWCAATVGIGAKQLGRLLGKIGNPYWHTAEGRPRTLGELRAYTGYHVVDGKAPRRKAGVKSNWNSAARMRLFLIAESCIKQRHSPYRPVYDAARAKYADALVDGKPITDGHAHQRALRAVAKAVLKDLWTEARDLTQADRYRLRVPRTTAPSGHPPTLTDRALSGNLEPVTNVEPNRAIEMAEPGHLAADTLARATVARPNGDDDA